jgi:proline iminopeptidase
MHPYASVMTTPPEPYETGMLDVGDGNHIYWEECGNPDGLPALIVHGGPGSGCRPGARRTLDPERFRIILFDQRNCGRSTPHASDPATDLTHNTTQHLIRDMEQLREHRGVQKWLLRGPSWGSTLSLAYAQQHPERVSGLLLVSVTSSRRDELNWLYRGSGRFYPEAWARFRDYVGAHEYKSPRDTEPPIEGLLGAYKTLLEDPDPRVRLDAAVAWTAWEDAAISSESKGAPGSYSDRPEDAKLAMVRICAHYFSNDVFLPDGILIRQAGMLAGIPGQLVHGRVDVSGPAITPWDLANAWPGAELHIVEDAGHTGSEAMRQVTREAAGRLYTAITSDPEPRARHQAADPK